jgi:glycosyltransferase involved in cell wall biosynthesis
MSTRVILVVTDNTPDQINGVVTTFRNLETQARADGYEIQYIHPGLFCHVSCPGYPEVKLSWPGGLGKKIRDIAPDHVHIATEGPLGLAARLWLDRQSWRYNTSYHTRFPEFVREIYGIPTSITYRYLRWFHKHSGRVLTTTDTMVQELQAHGFDGDIRSWTRGVDRDDLMPSRAWSHPRQFGSRPRVLYVGRVSREKNLEALCELSQEFYIDIVGDGPYRAELEREYPQVHFLGYRRGSALADCYAQADVFAFPSRADTFGIVMIEAMSLGTPVAGYPVPGPQDVIEPGVTGYMDEDLGRAIRLCLGLDRDRIRQDAERWTWHHCWSIFRDNLI